MNLIQGRLVDNRQIGKVLAELNEHLTATLCKPPLNPLQVVDACGRLADTLPDEQVLPVLAGLGMSAGEARRRLDALRLEFSRGYLLARLERELGSGFGQPAAYRPYGQKAEVTERRLPLGVLLHIAAGNMDGLPAYSVIEGMLTGNINLLKLPSADGGLSVMILRRLFEIDPSLAQYAYVFEMSSAETDSLLRLAQLANAIVVWGGDDAVRSVRGMAPPNVKLIEWGHKLSFAYVTGQGTTKSGLKGLAHHICQTNQLLCSSCQGIFVDTAELAEAEAFCKAFLPILQRAAGEYPPVPPAMRAQNTLQLYSRQLEGIYGRKARVFQGPYASLQLEDDSALCASLQFRSLWVKRLPQDKLIGTLHPNRGHLQTAALLCSAGQWDALRDRLWAAGVVRVTGGAEMSTEYCGGAHDGEYPLQRYTRVVAARP